MGLVSTGLKGQPSEYPKAIHLLEEKGIIPVPYDPIDDTAGPFSASDNLRARAFSEALQNPEFNGILSIRGGYGAIRLLGHLENLPWNLDRLPVWAGFSDATNLHAFLWKRFNAVTFHGPHLRGIGESPESFLDFWEVLSGKRGPGSPLTLGETEIIRPGTANGILLGGNLETLAHLAGTPWFPRFDNAILLVEDVDEPLYAIDRALWQMHHAGALRNLAGIVLGPFSGLPPRQDDPAADVADLVRAVAPPRVPILRSNRPGHDLPMSTWPLNVNVRLDLPRFGSPSLTLEESLFLTS
ncbi:MAG: S66 peptidase family protein [Leptospirales bacterium]